MATIPPPLHSLSARIDAALEAKQESSWRPHLGASILGHHCMRYVWLSFRWAVDVRHAGRPLRIFRRGQAEESAVVSDLRSAGLTIAHTGADQLRVDILPPHCSGSIDGLITSGVPEAPSKAHVLEIKTHSAKSWAGLSKGVAESKPQHHVQMQLYMHALGANRALYYAVCKDDDRIYTERVRYNPAVAERYIEIARWVIAERAPLPGVSKDPSWHECKMCPMAGYCHGGDAPAVNCRTCRHGVASDDGWRCEIADELIPLEVQRVGCEMYQRGF